MSLEETRREFWEAWNGLSEVHTQEALDAQSEKMWAARKRLLKVDPEFRAMLKARKDKANAEAEVRRVQITTKHKSIVSEAEAESRSIISVANAKVNVAMRMSDGELDEWIQKHRFKVIKPEEAEIKSKLICPICGSSDKGNIINDNPTCCHNTKEHGPWHRLVAASELKNYNRAYRRRWKRSRKSR